MSDSIPPKSLELVLRVIQISGLLFVLIGGFAFANPTLVQDFTGLDDMQGKIFSAVFIFIGVMDFIIVPKVLRKMSK